jgi:hypothetical protein
MARIIRVSNNRHVIKIGAGSGTGKKASSEREKVKENRFSCINDIKSNPKS